MCILNEPLKSELVFILVGAAKDAAVKHIKNLLQLQFCYVWSVVYVIVSHSFFYLFMFSDLVTCRHILIYNENRILSVSTLRVKCWKKF